MRTRWTMVAGVALVAAAAGVVVAGLPGGGDSFVLPVGATASTTGESAVGLAPLPSVLPTTTIATAEVASAGPEPTTAEVASAAPVPTSTTAAPTTSTTAQLTDPAIETLDRARVRVVLANGDGRFNLVGVNADRLLGLGYVTIEQDEVAQRPDVTTIYARAGFEDEALRMREDLGTPGAMIQALTDVPVTDQDADGDLIVVLGPDAQR